MKTTARTMIILHDGGTKMCEIKSECDKIGMRYCKDNTWIFADKSVLEINEDTLIEQPF